MKKFKISYIAILAIVLAIGLSSFTTAHKHFTKQWFAFSGSTNTMAADYTLAGGTGADPECAADPVTVCSIFATNDGGHPLQSDLDAIVSQSSNFSVQADNLEYRDDR